MRIDQTLPPIFIGPIGSNNSGPSYGVGHVHAWGVHLTSNREIESTLVRLLERLGVKCEVDSSMPDKMPWDPVEPVRRVHVLTPHLLSGDDFFAAPMTMMANRELAEREDDGDEEYDKNAWYKDGEWYDNNYESVQAEIKSKLAVHIKIAADGASIDLGGWSYDERIVLLNELYRVLKPKEAPLVEFAADDQMSGDDVDFSNVVIGYHPPRELDLAVITDLVHRLQDWLGVDTKAIRPLSITWIVEYD